MDAFEQETRRIEEAAAQLARERAALLRSDGQPVYAPDEQAEREAPLVERFTAAAGQAFAAVDEAAARAQGTLDALDQADPLDRLSRDELVLAAAKREFVGEDAARLQLAPLAERLRGVLAHGDAVDRVLWLRAAQRRAEDLLATRGPGAMGPEMSADVQAVQGLLAQLATAVGDPQAQAKRAAAEATLQAAREWRMAAFRRRGEIDGTIARQAAALRRHYGNIF